VPCPGGIRCGREFRRHRLAHEAPLGQRGARCSAPRPPGPRLWRRLCGFAGGRPFLLAGAARGARKSKPLWPWPPSRPPSRLRLWPSLLRWSKGSRGRIQVRPPRDRCATKAPAPPN